MAASIIRPGAEQIIEMNNNKYQPADKMLYKNKEASSFYVDLILKKGKPTHLLFKTLQGKHIFC